MIFFPNLWFSKPFTNLLIYLKYWYTKALDIKNFSRANRHIYTQIKIFSTFDQSAYDYNFFSFPVQIEGSSQPVEAAVVCKFIQLASFHHRTALFVRWSVIRWSFHVVGLSLDRTGIVEGSSFVGWSSYVVGSSRDRCSSWDRRL